MEEEVLIEVEAAQSVYGDDCRVLHKFPPHLHVHIRPRTAEVSSQQFVEAVIGIRASSQYPDEPPDIIIVDSKGLDEQRQKHLITSIRDKAFELSSCLMLVALFEEAVERLSSMNHPDGDCPLCLSPLVEEGAGRNALPFMKLMSCFHCFHCRCIIRWWNWLQMQKETDSANSVGPTARSGDTKTQQDMLGKVEESMGTCPVCRKVFHAKDIEHVLDLVVAYSQLSVDDAEASDNEKLLQSDSENIRRQKFEAIAKLQQESNGLIEPKRSEVLMPGVFLPRSNVTTPPVSPDIETSDQQHSDAAAVSESSTSTVASNRPGRSQRRRSLMRRQSDQQYSHPVVKSGTNTSVSSSRPHSSDRRSLGMRRPSDQQYSGPEVKSETNTSVSSNRPSSGDRRSSDMRRPCDLQYSDPVVKSGTNTGVSSNTPKSCDRRSPRLGKPRASNSGRHAKQWLRKENDAAN